MIDTERKKRTRTDAALITPELVSPESAAHMLGQISLNTLQSEFVNTGRLVARRISAQRIGYPYEDVCALARSLPTVTPGRKAPQADPQGA